MNHLYLISLFFITFLMSCSPNSETKTTENATTPPPKVEEKIYRTADEMPRFPGCEQLKGDVRNGCSGTEMFKFIKENLKYPSEAETGGKEGRAVIGFVVDKNGKIKDANIKQDPGFGMGAEAKRVVESFPTWIPGKHEGKEVSVQFNLPVQFKLESKE